MNARFHVSATTREYCSIKIPETGAQRAAEVDPTVRQHWHMMCFWVINDSVLAVRNRETHSMFASQEGGQSSATSFVTFLSLRSLWNLIGEFADAEYERGGK